jgi:hypothetical protein
MWRIALSYPTMCLLIASVHADTAGHAIFTFEMLHEYFRDQVRASSSAPVQVNGGSIGMVRCNREVLMSVSVHPSFVGPLLTLLKGIRTSSNNENIHVRCSCFVQRCKRVCEISVCRGKGGCQKGH